jgi:hypothetical protein
LFFAGSLLMTMQSCSKEDSSGCIDAAACNFNTEAKVDDGSCTYSINWYQDLNNDGYGNPSFILTDCNQPVGYSKGQCDLLTFWRDEDGDGLGDPYNSVLSCDSVEGYVDNDADNIDEVPVVKQRAIMVYQGATWCGPCGANGDPTKEHLESTYGNDIIILNCQSVDDISLAGAFGPVFGDQFASFYSPAIASIPYCYFSAANYPMSSDGFSSSPTQFDNDVDNVLATTAKVGIAAVASLSSGVVTIHTATKFVSASNEHYIGVYLLEDGVMADQTITGSANAITAHNNVVRATSSTSSVALGIESIGATFTADQIVNNTYTITVPSTVIDNSKLQVGVVVWDGQTADKISNAVIVDVNL